MVSKKNIRLALLSPWVILAFAVIGTVLYLLIPSILSLLSDQPIACGNPGTSASGQTAIAGAMSSLCSTSQAFLGVIIMLIVVLSGLASILSVILVSADIIQKQDMEGFHKFVWLAAIWLVLGYFAAVAYYFMVKQKESDPVQ